MLLHWLFPLADSFAPFNVVQYLTFRTGGAVMTALLISFLFGPMIIRWLKTKQVNGQPIRDDGPAGHLLTKQGTPTMGGVLLLLSLGTATLLWADLTNGYVWATLLVTFGFGLIGFADDYLKVTRASQRGLPGVIKVVAEIIVAGIAAWWISGISPENLSTGMAVPFIKDFLIPLGIFFVPVAVFVMVGASNSVNLTDGLDGLAIVPVMIAASSFALIAYLAGNTVFSGYLQINFVPGGWRTWCVLRGHYRCRSRLFVVQRAARHVVHGRHRQSLLGRSTGVSQRRHQARNCSGDHWRLVRIGNRFGDRPGGVFPPDRDPGFSHGAAAPSLRTKGLAGVDHRHSLLDHCRHFGPDRAFNPKAAVAP